MIFSFIVLKLILSFILGVLLGEFLSFLLNGHRCSFDEKLESSITKIKNSQLTKLSYIYSEDLNIWIFKQNLSILFKYRFYNEDMKMGLIFKFSKQAKRIDKIFEKLDSGYKEAEKLFKKSRFENLIVMMIGFHMTNRNKLDKK